MKKKRVPEYGNAFFRAGRKNPQSPSVVLKVTLEIFAFASTSSTFMMRSYFTFSSAATVTTTLVFACSAESATLRIST